ncbi:hypothetical protein SERLA73DRAFT_149188 [Serpula lacrymans var. lacrymans S7.3]|uniref:DUF6532 domain-containing protein n=1 Tax=Serpula lacrymans var. lacrymans (strain S7.3) TaxID=936435 RepID=F8PGC4_SERL3|nr:hypothetical protein SERLA73DRAFT_149188 [Serpula lacrymans var. lacrymans S7.3]
MEWWLCSMENNGCFGRDRVYPVLSLYGKKICLNGDDNDNNDNEDVTDNDDNADDGKNMIDHILGPAEISNDDQDNSVVPPLQPLSDDNEEEEQQEQEQENNNSSPKRVVDDNEPQHHLSSKIFHCKTKASFYGLPYQQIHRKCNNQELFTLAHTGTHYKEDDGEWLPLRLQIIPLICKPAQYAAAILCKTCQSIYWDLLVNATAAENDSSLVDKMKEIQDDQILKSQLLQYVRGELISKARISVPPTYGIKNIHKDKLSGMIYLIINSETFINNTIDLKEKMSDTNQPRRNINIIIKILFQAQWWGPKGEGRKYGRKNNLYLCNLPTLALIAYSIECALLDAINNTTIEFSETAISARWDHHIRLLEIFQKCSPTYLAAVFDEVDEYVWNGCITVGQSDVSELMFDFDALEEAAKASKS